VVRHNSYDDDCRPVEGASPKPDEVGWRHVDATTVRHGGVSLGHGTPQITCVGTVVRRESAMPVPCALISEMAWFRLSWVLVIGALVAPTLTNVPAMAQSRPVPFSRYVPADAEIYVNTGRFDRVNASLERANAWRVLQDLSGEQVAERSVLLKSMARFLGFSDQSVGSGLGGLEVGVAASSWADSDGAAWLLRPVDGPVLDRLLPTRQRVPTGVVGDASLSRTRGGVFIATSGDTAVAGRRGRPGSLFARTVDLLGGRSSDSLFASSAFREIAAYLPADPLVVAYVSGEAIRSINPGGRSAWRPSFERAAAALYEKHGRIEVALRAALAQPRKKPRLSDAALDRLFRLPDTTLFASAFTFDLETAYSTGAAASGTVGRYLRFLSSLRQRSESTGEARTTDSPKLGPHIIFVWGQALNQVDPPPRLPSSLNVPMNPSSRRDRWKSRAKPSG